MAIPFDVDILTFVWTTAKIIFGRKKRAQKLRWAIPVQMEYEEIPDHELTQAQRDYIQPFDKQLAALNYHPDCTYRIGNFRNLGRNLLRHYHNPSDPASCTLMIVEMKTKVGEVEVVRTTSHVAFRTRFSNETHLITRNNARGTLGDRQPWSITQAFRALDALSELKRRHDASAAKMGPPLPAPCGAKAVFEEGQREHQRFAEFQVQRGIYRLLRDGQGYEITDKAHLRGIWNHYNPFARRISWPSTILSALVGSVLPLFAIMMLVPLVSERMYGAPLTIFPSLTLLVIAGAYVVAGVIIGAVSDRAPFHWIMLISYAPAHVVAGWSFGWFPYSTLMFVVAGSLIRAKHRRAVILET